MIIPDFDKEISDKDYLNAMEQIYKYIKDNIINDFVATDIAICFTHDSLYAEPLDVVIDAAIEDLAQITIKLCDKKEIKKILEQKYHLRITNDNPIDIEEIKDWIKSFLYGRNDVHEQWKTN